jgi:metallo-beta-lactamase family protein
MHQGHRAEAAQRNLHLPFDPKTITAALLSHSHIDHSGNLPTFIKNGFKGSIHCTPATRDLVNLMLRDSANIQEQDADYLNQKKSRQGLPPVEPLYTSADAERALKQVVSHSYDFGFEPCPGVETAFFDAGHILGSAISVLRVQNGATPVRIGYTGDLGRRQTLILRDPETVRQLDYLIVEGTYGDRVHEPVQKSAEELAQIVRDTIARGGKVIIPAFAVERTQEVVYALHREIKNGTIQSVPAFVDSPLAINATDVYRIHPENLRDDLRESLYRAEDPFGFGHLRYTRSVEESKQINEVQGPAIIISANGMAEAGRILHHLKHNIEDERNSVVFVGYQAENTLGRRLVDGVKQVKIFGDEFHVRAQVYYVNGFSAHADRNELLEWVASAKENLKGVFVVHSEEQAALAFADALRPIGGFTVTVPEPNQSVTISPA